MQISISVSGLNGIGRDLERQVQNLVQQVADDTFKNAKKFTPVRSGNARKNWNEQVGNKKFTVQNKVPYIERLEAGASRQAPKGIIGPTLTTIKGKYK